MKRLIFYISLLSFSAIVYCNDPEEGTQLPGTIVANNNNGDIETLAPTTQ